MKDELISFETAVLAKEKGFKPNQKEVFYNKMTGYEKYEDIPTTQSLLQKWLRDEKFIDVFVINSIKENCYDWEIREEENIVLECDQYFHNYEAALEDALKEALKSLI